jgi:diguanylate cyclase
MNAENFHIEQKLRLNKEIDKLKSQLKKVTDQRRPLLKQLDKTENRVSQLDAFHKRIIPALVQFGLTSENKDIHGHLDEIKSLVKDGAPLDRLEIAFQRLKETTFKSDVQAGKTVAKKTKKKGLLKLFQKDPSPEQTEAPYMDGFEHLTKTYLEIIHELKLNLGKSTLPQLTMLERRLQKAQGVDDLLSIRKSILSLINDYITRVSTEREEAASFIREISGQLIEVERHLVNSVTFAKETQAASTSFTDNIESQLSGFKEAVDFSKSLQDLKSSIASSISLIQSAIENKRQNDTTRVNQADKQVALLQKDFNLMKDEIKSAKERAEQLEHELLIDPLTGIYNRRAYDFRIEEELKRFHRYGNIFAVIILDVDRFKRINDQYGHNVGDLCLKELINRIKPLFREADFLARFGGEEFVVLLPETRIDGAAGVAEKLRKLIEKTDFLHKGEPVKVTISLGVTEVRQEDTTYEPLFERADRAMYQAKETGRNRVVTL